MDVAVLKSAIISKLVLEKRIAKILKGRRSQSVVYQDLTLNPLIVVPSSPFISLGFLEG